MARVIKLVSIDLDGTLIPGDTDSLASARRLGRDAETRDLEARFRRGEITNAALAEITGADFAGRMVAELEAALAALLRTIAWCFAADYFRRRFGFDACSGTEMRQTGGRFTGKVTHPFAAPDKPRFVAAHCRRLGIALADCAAIGDSTSDLRLFREVGLAIALNGTPEIRAAAALALETRDLTDVLPWLAPDYC